MASSPGDLTTLRDHLHHEAPGVRLYLGVVREIARLLIPGSVQTIVTSPPPPAGRGDPVG